MQQKLEKRLPKLARFLKEIEIQFKWLFIWVFLFVFRRRSTPHARPLDPGHVRKVLFLRHDKLGDMVVTLSTFHTLKAYFPSIQIGVLASSYNRALVENDPAVSITHIYDKKAKGLVQTIRELSAEKYDVIIDLLTGPSVTALVIAMATCPGAYRIGVGKQGTSRFYDYYTLEDVIQSRHLHQNEMCRACLIPFGISLDLGVADSTVHLKPLDRERGEQFGSEVRAAGFEHSILINLSAGSPKRVLSEDKVVNFVALLSRAYPQLQFVLSYAPPDKALATRATDVEGDNVRLIPPRSSILDIISMLPSFDGVISYDTSICHIAALMDIPLLALYHANEVHFKRWYPYGKQVWVLRSPHFEIMDFITMPKLIESTETFLNDLFGVRPKQVTT